MELPHGVLVRNFKGPVPLHELNVALLKDSFTGFMRASLVNGALVEGILIYSTGKPVIAFSSDGKSDRPDNEQNTITSVMANEDAIIELFSLNDGQVRLAMDFCRDYVIRYQPPSAPSAPPQPVKEAPKPMPVQKPKIIREERPMALPEVRGTFVRSENVDNLRSYISSGKDETGHAIFLKQDGAGYAEYHLLFLRGVAVAAYSSSSKESGTYLLSQILPAGGALEFYHVDEQLIGSILKMYPHVTAALENSPEPVSVKQQPQAPENRLDPGPMEILRPDGRSYGMPPSPKPSRPEPIGSSPAAAHGTVTRPPGKSEYNYRTEMTKPGTTKPDTPSKHSMGIPARSLFEKNDRQSYNVEGSLGTPAPEPRSTGTLKGDMDDDADFVKKVEKEFVGNVDDLLKRLELSHLKVVPEKKKR